MGTPSARRFRHRRCRSRDRLAGPLMRFFSSSATVTATAAPPAILSVRGFIEVRGLRRWALEG
jgi:hypothetical protein